MQNEEETLAEVPGAKESCCDSEKVKSCCAPEAKSSCCGATDTTKPPKRCGC